EKTGALRWPPSCRVHVCTCRCVRPSVRRRGPHENGKPSSPEQQGLCTVRACASRLLSNGGPSGRSTSGSWVGSSFLRRPRPPWFTTIDRLSALVHRDVLTPDGLIASAPVSLERLHLRCECPGQLIESAFRTILLRDGLTVPEPTRERHRRHLNGSHLGRQQGFDLVPRLHPFDNREHEAKCPAIHLSAL